MTLGKDLIVTINDVAVAASKSCNLNMSQELIEVCSPVSGRAKDYIPGTYGWTVSTSNLCFDMTVASDMIDMIQNGTRVRLTFFDTTLGLYREGDAYLSGVKLDGAVGGLVDMPIDMQGCGSLDEIRRLSFDGDPLLMERIIEKSQGGSVVLSENNEVDLLYCNFTLTKAMRLVVTRNQYPLLPWILLTGNIDLYKQGIHDMTGSVTDLMDANKVAFEMQAASVPLQPGNYVLIKNSEGGTVNAELRR